MSQVSRIVYVRLPDNIVQTAKSLAEQRYTTLSTVLRDLILKSLTEERAK